MLIVSELNEHHAVAVLEGCVQLIPIIRIVDRDTREEVLEERDAPRVWYVHNALGREVLVVVTLAVYITMRASCCGRGSRY